MDGFGSEIATGVVMLIVGLLLRQLEPKSKLAYWLPHNFVFNLKEENVVLRTDSLTLQNLGRKTATDVEIIHQTRPDFFQFSTAVAFEESENPNGEHVIRVKHLGPKEFFNLQLMSYKTQPRLLNIRSAEGPATEIQIQLQRQIPKWLQKVAVVLLLVGAGFILYWVVESVIYLSNAIGIV